eukprot:11119468-Alexandrium_andersonii.AAC.1
MCIRDRASPHLALAHRLGAVFGLVGLARPGLAWAGLAWPSLARPGLGWVGAGLGSCAQCSAVLNGLAGCSARASETDRTIQGDR